MATPKPRARNRSRRFVALSAAAAAILAGVAVAFFLSQARVENNQVQGGTLVAARFDPLTFGGERLFPTDEARGGEAAVEDSFELVNTNPVRVAINLAVECSHETRPGVPERWVSACNVPDNQFQHLWVEISDAPAPPGLIPGFPPRPAPTVHYTGPLSGLTLTNLVLEAGASRAFDVRLWLDNIEAEQPQDVQTVWTFVVSTRTPPPAPPPAP